MATLKSGTTGPLTVQELDILYCCAEVVLKLC